MVDVGEQSFVFKPAVRAVWFAAFLAAVLAVVDRPSPQMGVFAVMLLATFVASMRALAVVRDGVIYRRRLFGSERLHFEDVAKVTLRRELSNRYFLRELNLTRADGSAMTFECWAWQNWQQLAHQAWHVVQTTGAEVDEGSRERLEALCPSDCRVEVPRAPIHQAPRLVDQRMTFGEFLVLVPAAAAFGFAWGTGAAWLRDDPEFKPEWQMGLALGGFFALVAVGAAVWDWMRPRAESGHRQ